MAIKRYNPDRSPPAADWLELDEQLRTRLIAQYHEREGDVAGQPELHALMHGIVENQLAEQHQPTVRALARLRRGGLDRHDAIHALASVTLPLIGKTFGQPGPAQDLQREMDDALDALTAEAWQAGIAGDDPSDQASPGPGLVRPHPGLTEDEIDRLAAFLDDLPPPAMNLEMVDGFFCALISGPDLVPPSEYLPEIWGDEPRFESEAEAREIMMLLLQLWNGIADTLLDTLADPDLIYLPILFEDDEGVVRGNDWAEGYAHGMALRPDGWESLHQDSEADCLVPMLVLLHEHDPDPALRPPTIPVEKRDDLIAGLVAGTAAAYRYFEPQRRASAQGGALAPHDTIRRSGPKVGRNDPCPCGSGRKYKRCCGAQTLH